MNKNQWPNTLLIFVKDQIIEICNILQLNTILFWSFFSDKIHFLFFNAMITIDMQQSLSSPIWLKQSMSLKLINYTLYKRLDGINNRSIIRLLFYFPILEKRLKTRKMYTFHFMHILHKILWKLCVGTCLLEPYVATPLVNIWQVIKKNQ